MNQVKSRRKPNQDRTITSPKQTAEKEGIMKKIKF